MDQKNAYEILTAEFPELKENQRLLQDMLNWPDKLKVARFGGVTVREFLRRHGVTDIPSDNNRMVFRQETPRGFK